MAKVLRVFYCNNCNKRAKIDTLTDTIGIVECEKCEHTELLDNASILEGLMYFYVEDQKLIEC